MVLRQGADARGALLLLGGVNFLLLRNTTKENALPRLRRLIEAEVGIGITVILTAASLTSQPPAVDQVSETVTMHQIFQRIKPVVPRLDYHYVEEAAGPDSRSGSSWQRCCSADAAGLQRGRSSADHSPHQQLDRVGVEPSLDGTGGAGHGIAGACWREPARLRGRSIGRCC